MNRINQSMPKKIPENIRRVYTELLSHPEWQDASVVAIHEEAFRRLRLSKVPKTELPQLPWAYKIANEFRTKLKPRDRWLDSPFSLHNLSDASFVTDPGSVEFLGLLMRRSVAGGAVLSNRRAIWATRISHFFPITDPGDHFWPLWWCWDRAGRYADSELSRSLVGEPASSLSLDRELLFVDWPENVLGTQRTRSVARLVFRASRIKESSARDTARDHRKFREKLVQLKQTHLLPTLWDDVIAERHLDIVDLLSGVYDNDSWDESLSAAEYDTTFLALRTIKNRDGEQWSQTKLEVQLELTDQLAKAVQNNEADSARELIRTTEPSKEVEA